MQALSERQVLDVAAPRFLALLIRHRFWIYFALLSIALGVIVAEQRMGRIPNSPAWPTRVAKQAPAAKPVPPTPEVRH